jgi:hypothetical protein
MTTEPTAPAPRARSRRLVILGIVVVVIVVGVLAVRPFPALVYPSWQLVGWELGDGVGGPRFDPAKARTTTVVAVGIWVQGTPRLPLDPSYLEPIITYTPWSVMITLRNPHAVDCGALPCVGGYTTTISFPVQLSEPLGGRAPFDGSQFPPAARPYP